MNAIYNKEEQERIEKAIQKFNWIKVNPADGIVELFADHHMLSTLRTCEAMFQLAIIDNVIPRQKSWPLNFGTAFHKWMEWFDEAEDKGFTGEWNEPFHTVSDTDYRCPVTGTGITHSAVNLNTWIIRCQQYWIENDLDQFHEENGFKELKGWLGAMHLLLQYWNTYGNNTERLRTVGTELGFGKDKEVPILTSPQPYMPFRAFLTGRIDRIVDNGHLIGPMDRKTHRYFKSGDFTKYKPHDGMQGYVYAINRILGSQFKEQGRDCNSVIIDMISLRDPTEPTSKVKEKHRFKRVPRDYKPTEMQEFIYRQQSSFKMLYELVVEGREPQWNTVSCHNQYYKDCQYKIVHEAPPEARLVIINSFFQQREERWSPYQQDKQAGLTEELTID